MKIKNMAGMSMKGGRRDKFFFCLLEFFPEKDRWFLKSILGVKDEINMHGDDAIRTWIEKFGLKDLVVDFPLNMPFCQTCTLSCPGVDRCPVKEVEEVKNIISLVLKKDGEFREKSPKNYERERIKFEQKVQNKTPILSKSFKRRLKKGFLPYWNRAIDLWIWNNYYDGLLEYFDYSYDSFGSTSLMILSRFSYLKRHFPEGLNLYEGNVRVTLLELFRAGLIHKYDLQKLQDLEEGAKGREIILGKIEKSSNIFIYDTDMEILVKNPRAFDSFLLAVTGQSIHMNRVKKIQPWAMNNEASFVAPNFD
jgi:hypothetical protein